MTQVHESARAQGRAFAGGTIVALAGLLAALALVYTNATGVADVADDARLQQQAESTLGAAASARNAIGQAILITGSTNDPSLVSAAVSEAASVLQAMEERVLMVSANLVDSAQLDDDLASALFEATATLDALTAGDVQRAGEIATNSSAAAFGRLVENITNLRNDLAIAISTASAESGTVATASRFMVAFFVPSMAVIAAFLVARRRRKRELLAIELEQERALNRSKDQLIANLSHELRTPLTGIYTSALAIEEAGVSDLELSRELTGIIIDQSADLTRMVEDLLVSAQADAGRLRFDLRPTEIEKLTADLQKEFMRFDAQIDFTLEPGLVLADPGRLRQLLRNLVSNAAKYGNGSVVVKGRLNDVAYVVEVVDNGPGVPPDVEKRMFERFVHRGDQPLLVGSVGLGLAISKVLAEGMSGAIAYHRSDTETTFEVTLELAADPRAQMPPDPAPYDPPTVIADHDSDPAHNESPPDVDPQPQMPPDPAPYDPPTVVADDSEPSPQSSLGHISLPAEIRACLQANGIHSVRDLLTRSPGDLLAIKGIGPARLVAIGRAVAAHASTSAERGVDPDQQMPPSVAPHDRLPAVAGDDPPLRLDDISLPKEIRACLQANGVHSIQDLMTRSTGDLLAIKGIGPTKLVAIGRAVTAHASSKT